jgi:uncharacterized protein YjbI with pentapeptide repeats
MIDHSKIENAIDNYSQNYPTANIIEHLDGRAIDRKKDLDRENIDCLPVDNKRSLSENLVRFEDVSPANRSWEYLDDNLEKSIECLYESLQIYTQDDFPEKWERNQQELNEFQQAFKIEVLRQQSLNEHIILCRRLAGSSRIDNLFVAAADLKFTDLSCTYLVCADLRFLDLSGINLSGAKIQRVKLSYANLSGANLSDTRFITIKSIGMNLSNANLSDAKLNGVNLIGANLNGANVNNTKFSNECGLPESVKQDLMLKGAIFS